MRYIIHESHQTQWYIRNTQQNNIQFLPHMDLVKLYHIHTTFGENFDIPPIDGFQGAWLHFQRARVCIQCKEALIKSLPSVLKDKRSCFSRGERSAVQ